VKFYCQYVSRREPRLPIVSGCLPSKVLKIHHTTTIGTVAQGGGGVPLNQHASCGLLLQ
jgi:hypothetical protein